MAKIILIILLMSSGLPSLLFAQSMYFDGVDDYVLISNEPNFDFERTDKFMVCFWVKTTNSGAYTCIPCKYNTIPADDIGYALIIGGTNLWILINDGKASNSGLLQVTSVAKIKVNEWTHCAILYDGSCNADGLTFFINGVVSGKTINTAGTLSQTIQNADSPRIGKASFIGATYPVYVDDLMIYKTNLSTAQIQNIYAKKFRGSDRTNNLITNINFGEAINNNPADTSGNNNGIGLVYGAIAGQSGGIYKK